jgi:competence protein ComEC
MIFAYLVARFLDREQAALNAIGAAGLALLLVRPAWLFETGFQMSFAAVLIIAGLAVPILQRTTEPFRRALADLDDAARDATLEPRAAQWRLDLRALLGALRRRSRFLEDHPAFPRALVLAPAWAAVWTANVLLFSAIVQLGLMLPMAETFHRVTLAGVGLNALAMPLMTALLAVALPTAAIAAASPALAVVPARLLAGLANGLLFLTEFPGLPAFLSFRVPEPPGWVSAGFIAALIVAALSFGRARRVFLAALASGAVLLVLISIHPFAPRLPRGTLEVTVLDCGGADAMFVVFPDRTTMLLGACGSRASSGGQGAFRGRRWDPGEDLVSPYLWQRGLKRLDVVVFPRPAEQLDGMDAVLKNFQVAEVWWPGRGVPISASLSEGARVRRIAAGDAIELGTSKVEILWPDAEREPASRAGDESVVLKISEGAAKVLLAGDISSRVERELVAREASLEASVLKVAGPGSRATSSEEFLARVRPRLAVVSVAADDRFGRPDAEVLERLKQQGARVFRTDLNGAVTIEMRERRAVVRTYAPSSGEAGASGTSFYFELP